MKTNRIFLLVSMAGILGIPYSIKGMDNDVDGGRTTKVYFSESPEPSLEPEPEEPVLESGRRSRKNSKSSNRSSPIPLEKLQMLEKRRAFEKLQAEYANKFPSWIETDGQRLLWTLAINDTGMALTYITEETANCSDPKGFYALHYAALGDNKRAVKKLLECGADTRVQTKDKKTPFLLAFEHKRRKTFRALKKYAPREEQEEIQRRDKNFIPQFDKE